MFESPELSWPCRLQRNVIRKCNSNRHCNRRATTSKIKTRAAFLDYLCTASVPEDTRLRLCRCTCL